MVSERVFGIFIGGGGGEDPLKYSVLLALKGDKRKTVRLIVKINVSRKFNFAKRRLCKSFYYSLTVIVGN